ncbi:MAG: hypothetical protein LT071_14890 [Nocardioides sp.]|nr:hypothetical protein [Nocardioides sp.]
MQGARDRVVWLAALAAVVLRAPSLLWPLRPDEAGFIMVARSWEAQPDSLYGRYWVDRPPQVISLMGLTDQVGGPYLHRAVGALLCALLVITAAAAARELARWHGLAEDSEIRRVSRWTAVVTAALVGNAEIDAVAVKGELLGIPLVMWACWLVLRAVRRRSWLSAFVAGMLGALALGMKQNLVGGLVFGAVLLVGAAVTGRIGWRLFAVLAAAATAGGAVPVVATVAGALASGVRLHTLWYTVVAFRADASAVIAAQDSSGATSRVGVLVAVFVGTGMAALLVWFAVRLPWLLRHLPVPTLAITAMLAFDTLGVALSGSYWTPYLFVPIPTLVMAMACVLVRDQEVMHLRTVTRATRVLISLAVVSTVLSLAGWLGTWAEGRVPVERRTGEAIAAASPPGSSLLVYGGRADIQFYSGQGSPYPHLWSLPMRTLDPELDDLQAVLTGADPPTWFVEAARLDAWSELGTRPVERSLLRKYEFVVTACDRYRIFRLNSVDPVRVDVDCDSPARGWFASR